MPIPTIQHFDLPAASTVRAGFSGATIVPGSTTLLFTASLENTANEIEDGEVLGSFVGIIDLQQPQRQPVCLPIVENGQPYAGKVESITIVESGNGSGIRVWAVTDNDLGGSEILEILLPG